MVVVVVVMVVVVVVVVVVTMVVVVGGGEEWGGSGRIVGKRPISFSTKDGPARGGGGGDSVPNTIVLVNGVHYK